MAESGKKVPFRPVYFHKLICYNMKEPFVGFGKENSMSKFYEKQSSDLLYRSLLELKSVEECRQFFAGPLHCIRAEGHGAAHGGGHAAGPGAHLQ